MTTIVWRDGVMAADTRAYSGDHWAFGQKIKIRCHEGVLMGVSSNQLGVPSVVLDWFCEGAEADSKKLKDLLPLIDQPSFSLLTVDENGIGGLMFGHGLMTYAEADYYTIGSGEVYALGALAQGATAYEAVLAACQFDKFTAEPITVLDHTGADACPLRKSP